MPPATVKLPRLSSQPDNRPERNNCGPQVSRRETALDQASPKISDARLTGNPSFLRVEEPIRAAQPSTKRFKRWSASSHCAEIDSRCRRASASRFRSISQRLSRPRGVRRTRPAASMTCRCFVIACRVMPKRSVSRVIEAGPASHNRETRPSRVSSPRAKNTAAESAICACAPRLR